MFKNMHTKPSNFTAGSVFNFSYCVTEIKVIILILIIIIII